MHSIVNKVRSANASEYACPIPLQSCELGLALAFSFVSHLELPRLGFHTRHERMITIIIHHERRSIQSLIASSKSQSLFIAA